MAKVRFKHNWPTKSIRALSSAKTKPGDKAFHLKSHFIRTSVHSKAFRKAAEMVLDSIIADGRRVHGELFFPVAYLYRHCLEIKLKDLIRTGIHIQFFNNEQSRKLLSGHKLMPLWFAVRKLLENEWKGAPPGPLDGIEVVVKQFNKADPDGQTLRYELDKQGKRNSTDKLPEFIRISTLRRTMAGVFNLLETCDDLLRSNWSD